MANKHLQDNPRARKKFRIIGFISFSIGLICVITAMIDFFTADFMPKLFFLFFIGMPFLFVGGVCLNFGYMRAVSKYTATETAPVAKDVANYMLAGTRDELAKTISAVRGEKVSNGPMCGSCGTQNEVGANYCDNCGKMLSKVCSCGEKNDSDARFCRKCGNRL
ncbi:MAG TPA: zinc ribbon domain-containing protein [Acholeplasmataceae bacterium]|nr:zinc ribbon domain-containing protein [Acholeplasmataceae bacterium]